MSPNRWPTFAARKKSNGFVNPHNYCYRNSVYVTLMHLPDFLRWLRGHQAGFCHRAQADEFCAACRLRTVATNYWDNRENKTQQINNDINSATETSRYPYPALEMLDLDGDRDTSSMQDAAEFLRFLIDDICTDFKKDLLQPRGFDELFSYRMHEQWECPGTFDCHRRFKDVSTVPISVITITNQQGDEMIGGTLEEYLTEHFFNLCEPRTVEPRICDACSKTGVERELRQLFFRAPQYLILQLSATSWASGSAKKVISWISLPLAIDLSEHMDPRQEVYYKLITTVYHDGEDMDAGHYVAVTTAPNGKFYYISDEYVDEAADASYLQAITVEGRDVQPYLVTYAKCSKEEYNDLIILQEELLAQCTEQGSSDEAPKVAEIHNDDQESGVFEMDGDEAEPATMEVGSIQPDDPFDTEEEELFGTFN